MSVAADEYEEKMNPEAQFKLTATCRVVESKHLQATTEAFSLRKPALEFEVSGPFFHASSVEIDCSVMVDRHLNAKLS